MYQLHILSTSESTKHVIMSHYKIGNVGSQPLVICGNCERLCSNDNGFYRRLDKLGNINTVPSRQNVEFHFVINSKIYIDIFLFKSTQVLN